MSNRPRLKLGRRRLLLHGAAAAAAFQVPAVWAQATPSAEVTSRIARALGSVLSIDNHTHLLTAAPPYSRQADAGSPLLLRSTRPEMVEVLRSRFGIAWDPTHGERLDAEGRAARQRLIERAGGTAAYWAEHLALSGNEVVLVNQYTPEGTDGRQLRWVATISTLLAPLPGAGLAAGRPHVGWYLETSQSQLRTLWAAERQGGAVGPPATLAAYLAFCDRRLSQIQQQGAVAVKLYDAYYRSLRIADVPFAAADALYTRGLLSPLARDDYLALQDHLLRHLLLRCGELKLPVHIHSSHGAGPFLRLQDADVRNLEDVLTDPRFGRTQFVLIHGGAPWHEAAAYLAGNKRHVWLDLSAMPFLYAPSEMARAIRTYLLFAPERTLFGTDPMAAPMIPIGPETAHLMLCRVLRRALDQALAGLVEDGVFGEAQAIEVGRGVLRENARRLYGWA